LSTKKPKKIETDPKKKKRLRKTQEATPSTKCFPYHGLLRNVTEEKLGKDARKKGYVGAGDRAQR